MDGRTKYEINPQEFNKLRNKFLEWYLQAKPYDWFTYHHGLDLHETLVVESVRQVTWDYATRGFIYLFIKRDPVDTKLWFFRCQKSKHPTRRLIPKP